MIPVAILLVPVVAAFLLGTLYGPAVQALHPGNAIMTASDHTFQTDSFSLMGSVGSTLPLDEEGGEPEVVTGAWAIDVQEGNVAGFLADLSMINADGTGYLTVQLSNLTSESVVLYPNGTARINGTLDVVANGTDITPGVDASISVAKLRAITLIVDSQNATGSAYAGQPLYGIADQPELESVNASTTTTTQTEETGLGLNNITDRLKLPQLPNPFR